MANTRLWTVFILISTFSLVSAQTLVSSIPTRITSLISQPTYSGTIPTCAQSCLANATSSLPCQDTDSRCLCLHTPNVEKSVGACLNTSNACSSTDFDSAVAYYGNLCQALGYQIGLITTTAVGSAGPQPTVDIVSATGVPSPVPTHQTIATATATSTSSSSGLSTPEIAGIAAAAGLFVLISIGFMIYFCMQRRPKPDERMDSQDTEMRRRRSTQSSHKSAVDLEKKLPPLSPPTTAATLVPRPKSSRSVATEFSDATSFKTTRENISVEHEKSGSRHSERSREKINPLTQHPSFRAPKKFDFGLRAPTPGGFAFDFNASKDATSSPNISRRPSDNLPFDHTAHSSISSLDSDYQDTDDEDDSESVTIGIGVARTLSIATTATDKVRNSNPNDQYDGLSSKHHSKHSNSSRRGTRTEDDPPRSRWGDAPAQNSKHFV